MPTIEDRLAALEDALAGDLEISALDSTMDLLGTDEFVLNRPTDPTQAPSGTNFRVARDRLVTFPLVSDDGTTRHELTADGPTTEIATTDDATGASAVMQQTALTNQASVSIAVGDGIGHSGNLLWDSGPGGSGFDIDLDGVQVLSMSKDAFAIQSNDDTTTHSVQAENGNELVIESRDDATGAHARVVTATGADVALATLFANGGGGSVAIEWGVSAGAGAALFVVDGLNAMRLNKDSFTLQADDGTTVYTVSIESNKVVMSAIGGGSTTRWSIGNGSFLLECNDGLSFTSFNGTPGFFHIGNVLAGHDPITFALSDIFQINDVTIDPTQPWPGG